MSQSVLSQLGVSCYILADTYFISKGVGADGTKALWFETKADFLAQTKDILKDGDNVLIKASHGMEFPEIVEALR